jgi:hypothetical protein
LGTVLEAGRPLTGRAAGNAGARSKADIRGGAVGSDKTGRPISPIRGGAVGSVNVSWGGANAGAEADVAIDFGRFFLVDTDRLTSAPGGGVYVRDVF